MPTPLRRWLPLALLAGASLAWALAGLDRRPMHADEANQAVKAGTLLQSGAYAYDPGDHHGPVLYYAAAAVALLRGQHTLAQMDETTVRAVPALAGALSVLLLGILAAPLGRWPSLAAASFLALSPPAAYYSRYFVQETLLCTFLLGALACGARWLSGRRLGWALAAGACAGLMQATKESAPFLALAAWVALAFAAGRGGRPPATHAVGAVLAAAVVAALFYSSFGTNPAGLGGLVEAYRIQAGRLGSGSTGHEKPWWYYAGLFGWESRGGLVFQQVGFSALALGGLWSAFRAEGRLLRWAAAYTLIVLGVLSATPYKTPWHAVHLVPGMALLAAGFLAWLAARPSGRWLSVAAAAAVLLSLAFQADRVTRRYGSDPRNPYAYVHSSPDVLKLRGLAEAALARDPQGVVRVVSEEYWPIPWYLRGMERVGYWSVPPADCDGELVIASAGCAEVVRSRLHGSYAHTYLGLRPGFVLEVFSRR